MLSRLRQSAALRVAVRPFATGSGKGNEDLINPEMFAREKALFNGLPKEEQARLQKDREVTLASQQQALEDPNTWWNKIATMSEADLKLLPYGFLKKYGSYIHFLRRMEREAHMSENKRYQGYYDQIARLNRLFTDEEKQYQQEKKEAAIVDKDVVEMKDLIREEGDYFKRQPRVDLSSYNYNFEQFRRYTGTYEKAKKLDDQASNHFYKMAKYVKENRDKTTDPIVRKFTEADGFHPELIEIPEEFENLDVADFGKEVFDMGKGRTFIRNRSNKNLDNYDAWPCTDRQVLMGDGKHHSVAKIHIAPAALIRTFGWPETSKIFYQGSGHFAFEDNNLDCYSLFDYKKTDLYYGLNRDDAFYQTDRNLAKMLHKRKQKRPSLEDFWLSEEPQELKLACDDQADWKKFRRWLRKTVADREKLGGDFTSECEAKYGKEVGICHGDFAEKGVLETNPAAFNYDFTYHMTKDELKAFKDKPAKIEKPKMFDLSKAERVAVDKDEIKRQEMEREQQKLSDA